MAIEKGTVMTQDEGQAAVEAALKNVPDCPEAVAALLAATLFMARRCEIEPASVVLAFMHAMDQLCEDSPAN